MRSLQAPAAGSSRAASRRRARALRSARAAGVSGRDRGEWTRFLELSSEGGRPASVEVSLQPSGAAAEVTVVAPDRAGLLSDITTAITQAGLSIAKARAAAGLCRR